MPLVRIARSILMPNAGEPEGSQYGAIPYRVIEGQVAFLMITSRRSANWVFPKGSPIDGLTAQETVAQEAWEEAGIRGQIASEAVGNYVHTKNNKAESLVRVHLFPMLVTEQADDWPEEDERFRHWALLPQVRRLMASRAAAKVAAEFNKSLLRSNQVPGNNRITA